MQYCAAHPGEWGCPGSAGGAPDDDGDADRDDAPAAACSSTLAGEIARCERARGPHFSWTCTDPVLAREGLARGRGCAAGSAPTRWDYTSLPKDEGDAAGCTALCA